MFAIANYRYREPCYPSSMDATEKVRRNIIRFRKEKGYTQERLAFESDVSKSYLCEVEAGKKSPTIRILEKIADTLEIPLYQLVK